MKKNHILTHSILIFSLLLPVAGSAALPPYWQSVREIRAMLENPDVVQRLHSVAEVEQIKRTDKGYDLTLADGCTVSVDVIYLPTREVGPAKFELKIVSQTCPHH